MKRDEYIAMLQREGPQTSGYLRDHNRTNMENHARIMRQLLASGAIEQRYMRGKYKLYSIPNTPIGEFGICSHCGGSGKA